MYEYHWVYNGVGVGRITQKTVDLECALTLIPRVQSTGKKLTRVPEKSISGGKREPNGSRLD